MVIQQYKLPDNTIYLIETLEFNDITEHCNTYFNELSLTNNTLFHSTEVDFHKELMRQSINQGISFKVSINGIEEFITYSLNQGVINHVVLMYTHDNEEFPIAKIIGINYLYSLNKLLRYTPKDIYNIPNNSLFSKYSIRLLQDKGVESIRFMNRLFEDNILQYLKLELI